MANGPIAEVETVPTIPMDGTVLPDLPSECMATPASFASIVSFVQDTVETFKLRITAMVVLTAWAGFRLGAAESGVRPWGHPLFYALAGIGLVTCGASVLNEVIERDSDAKMLRTAHRPLAAGRLRALYGTLLGLACIAGGAAWLVVCSNLLVGVLTLLTAVAYAGIYTPLKRYTPLATFVGAVPGAMPPLLGWVAARGAIEWPALALFAFLYAWQIPHFMAIAWLYREDYKRAAIQMLPVVHPDGRSTSLVALADVLLLLPISMLPGALHLASGWYFLDASILGAFYLLYTARFFRATHAQGAEGSRQDARFLLRASVVYLPLLLLSLMFHANA